MFRFYLHRHAIGVQSGEYSISHLAGQPLLDLGPMRSHLKGSGKLAQPSDFSIGDVGKMCQSEKGQ